MQGMCIEAGFHGLIDVWILIDRLFMWSPSLFNVITCAAVKAFTKTRSWVLIFDTLRTLGTNVSRDNVKMWKTQVKVNSLQWLLSSMALEGFWSSLQILSDEKVESAVKKYE
ncbi:hypothetical protein YC2023_078726 [Brassica napus]